MPNNVRGKRSGKRGGDFRPSKWSGQKVLAEAKKPFRFEHPVRGANSTSALIEGAAKHFDYAEIGETSQSHIIPRQSLTNRYRLPHWEQQVEKEALTPTKHTTFQKGIRVAAMNLPPVEVEVSYRDKDGNVHTEKMGTTGRIAVTDETPKNRITWKSDKTLLRRNRPMPKVVNVGTETITDPNHPEYGEVKQRTQLEKDTYRRITSKSKVIRIETVLPAVVEVEILPSDVE